MARCHFAHDDRSKRRSNRTIAVIGYGNQGRSQALNLRDSGEPRRRRQPDRRLPPTSVGDEMDVLGHRRRAPRCRRRPAQRSRRGPARRLPRTRSSANLRVGGAICVSHGFNFHFKTIRAASRSGRDHGRAQDDRRVRSEPLRRRLVASPRSMRSISDTIRPVRWSHATRPRQSHGRRDQGRVDEHLRGGDRDRPLRRAGGRGERAPLDALRVRDARRSWLRPRHRRTRLYASGELADVMRAVSRDGMLNSLFSILRPAGTVSCRAPSG